MTVLEVAARERDDKLMFPERYNEVLGQIEPSHSSPTELSRYFQPSPSDPCFSDSSPMGPLPAQIIRVLKTLYPNPSILRARLDLAQSPP